MGDEEMLLGDVVAVDILLFKERVRRRRRPIHPVEVVVSRKMRRTIPKLPFPKIEDVSSITQCNSTIVELVSGLFLTPTQVKLMEELG